MLNPSFNNDASLLRTLLSEEDDKKEEEEEEEEEEDEEDEDESDEIFSKPSSSSPYPLDGTRPLHKHTTKYKTNGNNSDVCSILIIEIKILCTQINLFVVSTLISFFDS